MPSTSALTLKKSLQLLAGTIVIIGICESSAPFLLLHFSSIEALIMIRISQIFLILFLIKSVPNGFGFTGFSKIFLKKGIKTGIVSSAVLAVFAAILSLFLAGIGIDPLPLIKTSLPVAWSERIMFLCAGVFISPAAEELFFRGILFSTLKRAGILAALLVSSGLFAFFHSGSGLPWIQFTGGIIFAAAFHHSKSIAAPIIIHCLGNGSIFILSLINY